MRTFYQGWEIWQTPSAKLEARANLPKGVLEIEGQICSTPSGKLQIRQTLSAESQSQIITAFPLSWSHYVRLMSVEKPHARIFYEAEAIRGGWSVRQLEIPDAVTR
jgi:hypothetical protein